MLRLLHITLNITTLNVTTLIVKKNTLDYVEKRLNQLSGQEAFHFTISFRLEEFVCREELEGR